MDVDVDEAGDGNQNDEEERYSNSEPNNQLVVGD